MSDYQRLFFALWPDDALRQRIYEMQPQNDNLMGRFVAKENYHITLAFMAKVSDRQWERLEMNAATLQFPAFELQLDQLGYWQRAEVMWIGCQHTPDELLQLVEGLKQMLHQVGLPIEKRDYQPHLSIRRKMPRGPKHLQAIPAITWPVKEFVLSRSITHSHGPEYQVIGRWPLHSKKSSV